MSIAVPSRAARSTRGTYAARQPRAGWPTPRSPRSTSTTSSTSSTRCARGADLRGRIVEVRSETAQSATLVIKPGRDWAGHVPGQYLRVGVDVDGVRLWRTYSLTHGPRADRCISITVKAIPGGVVSNHLVSRVRAGQMIQLGQAEGDFVLADPMPAKLLLVTAGSGITPVIGMLRNLFSRATPVPTDIVLLHSALSHSEVIFGEELRGVRRPRADPPDRAAHRHRRPARRRRPRPARARPRRAHDVRLRARRAARRPRGPPHRARPAAAPSSGSAPSWSPSAREARSPSPPASPSRPTAPPRSSTPPRGAGVLMPSGCRMGVCFGCVAAAARGRRTRPAQRPAHHRRAR